MSENVMITPLFHQRSHSMPVGRTFINGNPVLSNGNGGGGNGGIIVDNHRNFDFKRSSPLKPDNPSNNQSTNTQLTTSEGFPLPIPKSLTSQFRTSPLNHLAAINHNELNDISNDEEEEPKFFCQPKNKLNLIDYHKKTGNCPIILNCKMDRGFFVSQSHWTCYRRNYFQVTASFIIPGHSDQTYYALQLKSDRPVQPIQQFFLRLKASTSTSSSLSESNESNTTVLENHNMVRAVALTQMTPKRDKGPQREPPTIPITPSDSVFGSEQVCVTFERLQFRVATANNGKRRASQQYFRLIFELIAQLDDASQHVVSECYSSPLVVRGRSPGHYSSEPQRDLRKKRKLTPSPKLSKKESSSPTTASNSIVGASTTVTSTASPRTITTNSPPSPPPPHPHPHPQQQQYQHVVTLPPPQYVYNAPSLVVDTQRQSSNENTSSSSSVQNSANSPISYHANHHHHHHQQHQQQQQQQQQQLMPHMMNSAFSNFHARSQSANDSELFARHRNGLKYQSAADQHHQQDDMFDNYNAGIERALRNWQQQVVRQRTDSAATFDSYMSSSNEHDNRSSTRPGTPIPYHAQQQQQFYNQGSNNNWPPPPTLPPTSRHHYEEKYQQQQQQQQELSPKLYQQQSR